MLERDWVLDEELNAFPTDWLKVAAVTPNIMLALAYHMNFFPIYKGKLFVILGLKNSCDEKMSKASLTGLLTVAFFYIITGNIGYALYGSKVQANFLLNLESEDINHILYFGMNGGFLISVFFSFPVMFFGARNNFIALGKMVLTKNNKKAKIAA
jgi:amino acid permease